MISTLLPSCNRISISLHSKSFLVFYPKRIIAQAEKHFNGTAPHLYQLDLSTAMWIMCISFVELSTITYLLAFQQFLTYENL